MTIVLQESLDTDMKKILFVCTGNTCRSPMAQAVFNDITKRKGLEFHSDSCGLNADGSAISKNAHDALLALGINFESFSKQINKEMLSEADYVIAISQRHRQAVISMFPEYTDKVFDFPFDISDPYGSDFNEYALCLQQIKSGVEAILEELIINDNK